LTESTNLPEPDPFTDAEFDAWRGLIRMREAVMREVDRRLRDTGEMSVDDYGVLITLVGQPARRLRMSALAERRLLTASGITRAVMRLEKRGLVRRDEDPDDRRASFAVLTDSGLAALRRAQRVHHATVRELYLGQLSEREQRQLARLFEKALPGVVSSEEWPPPRLG
jgi:DNA-binding MarR family transcriptional regulator